jgi:hypothetical protein
MRDGMPANGLLSSVAKAMVVAMLSGNAATAADQNSLVVNTAIDGPALTFDWPAIEVSASEKVRPEFL